MATQVVTGDILFNPSFTEVISAGVINNLSLPASFNLSMHYANATNGALTIDQVHAKVYALAAAATTIDLSTLLDLNGNAQNFTRVRDFIVYNLDPVASHIVTVYKGATNGWGFLPASTSPLTAVAIGGVVWLHDPSNAGGTNGMVTSGSSKTITLDPGSNTVNVSVLIVGGTVS